MQMKRYWLCLSLQLKEVWRGCAAKVPARHRALASGVMELIPFDSRLIHSEAGHEAPFGGCYEPP